MPNRSKGKGIKGFGPNTGGRIVDNPDQRRRIRKRAMGKYTGKSMDGLLAEEKRVAEKAAPDPTKAKSRRQTGRVRQRPNPPRLPSNPVILPSDIRDEKIHMEWLSLNLPEKPVVDDYRPYEVQMTTTHIAKGLHGKPAVTIITYRAYGPEGPDLMRARMSEDYQGPDVLRREYCTPWVDNPYLGNMYLMREWHRWAENGEQRRQEIKQWRPWWERAAQVEK